MKRIPLPIAIILFMVSCNGEDKKPIITGNPFNPDSVYSDSANYTSIVWLDSTHQELGKIKEGQTPEIAWKFKNTGDKPLVVINAQGTCGCTVAEKPVEPVPPGGEGIIKAKFSSEGRLGINEKQVMVTTNTKGRTHHSLNFKVEVEKK